METSLLCIAIDFGTAYSGYSVKSDDPGIAGHFRDIHWGHEYGIRSCKTPTCILFDKTEKFVDFGYAAMRKSTSYLEDNTGYYFENFKMELYKHTNLTMDKEISAVNGHKMRAIKVISESLRFLKQHALDRINNFSTSITLVASDITWVLTVPAIWDDAAKQFMREAAKQAGLVTDSDPDNLIMALEPEAASVYCKQIQSADFVGGKDGMQRLDTEPGIEFVTVDCGGGTIDITVHEVLDNGALKQVDQASGNDLGGQSIDRQLKSMLRRICGDDCWAEYEKKHADELHGIINNFASVKCGDENEGFRFQCYNFTEIIKKYETVGIEGLVQRVHGVSWKNGFIIISAETIKSFFDISLNKTIELLNSIMKQRGMKIKYMLLVGGFALSKILQSNIKKHFGRRCTILCPQHPQQAVMVGAAEFGSCPEIIKSRICPLTYGVNTTSLFDESKHKTEKKYTTSDGIIRCSDIFHKLVTKGESVDYNDTRDHTFYPVEKDQTSVTFKFFSTTKNNAEYVDGLKQIDSLTVPMPNTEGGTNRKICLKVRFGFTEIIATATDLTTGLNKRVAINFMGDL